MRWGQVSSVAQSYLTLDSMDCSMPGFPDHHQLPQTHVHRVSDAIQPSHPLSPPSSPALSLSQHQGVFPMSRLFTSGGQSIGASASASVLPMSIQGWFPLGLTGLISLLSRGFSRAVRNTYPSPTSRVHPKPCPSSGWYHPTISSSVVPYFSCL